MQLTVAALYAKAKTLARDPEDHFLELGRTLRRLLHRDPDKFRQLWQDGRIGRRRAYYLIEVDAAFRDLPVSRARLRDIGWTKLQLLAANVHAGNVEELLDLAETMPAKSLARALDGEKVIDKPHCVLMYLDDEEFEMLAARLAPFGAVREGRALKNKEAALLAFVNHAAMAGGASS